VIAHVSWVRDWAPVTVAVCALLFTVGSFWWLYLRRGKLVVATPQTYAAFLEERRLILLFPLVFYNTGARDYVVRDLRVRFGDESGGVPLDWERVRGGETRAPTQPRSWPPRSPCPAAQGCASLRSSNDGPRIEQSTPEPIRSYRRA
jgi:hypothetical protein